MKDSSVLFKSVTRRKVQIVLGILWLLDGFLQLQRQMFSDDFANKVINPSSLGQPLIVSGPIHFEVHILLLHPALFNTFFAVTQLLIGLLILYKGSARIGLLGSCLWALMVWYLGEGLGGLLGLHTSLLVGLPGAVILYAILALAVMPNKNKDFRPAFWLPIVWATLWVCGAIYQLLPGQNSAADISSIIVNNTTGAPNWLASLDVKSANFISTVTHNSASAVMHMNALQMSRMQNQTHSGLWFIGLVAIFEMLIGLLIFLPGKARVIAVSLGITASLVFWVLGQNLGNYFTGLMTDPNAAPLFILLGITILGCRYVKVSKLFKDSYSHLERFLT